MGFPQLLLCEIKWRHDFIFWRYCKAKRTVNYRPFQLLVFKDSINEFRIDYLKKQDYEVSCGESFKLLQSKSAVLRNMILKGNIAGYRDKESIVNFISETRQADKVFCDLIIKDLRG